MNVAQFGALLAKCKIASDVNTVVADVFRFTPASKLKTAREILIEARDRIESPKHWTKGISALDKDGSTVDPQDPRATRWCALGTLEASTPDDTSNQAAEEFGKAMSAFYATIAALNDDGFYGSDITSFNDSKKRTHEEVIGAFNAAIKSLDNK